MTEIFIVLPAFDRGFPDAELVRWVVAEGQQVHRGEAIAEVETYKSLVETVAPVCGVVGTLHAVPGTLVQVGERLMTIDPLQDCEDCRGR